MPAKPVDVRPGDVLDEVWVLRGLSAHAASQLAPLLDLKTLPVAAREAITEVCELLHDGANGKAIGWARGPVAGLPFRASTALRQVGASTMLTLHTWQEQWDQWTSR